ncbi:MAG: anaerobic ribonucleoside-triphosphate reductase activating protein [Clostridiales bacterium]|nr:anaerobic ribonucleoside-triphosphate reductase activating protein [Clostridiales bacterium]
MEINGIQKLTLLDYPGKVACTVFLAGCDLRCPFCHNSELWSSKAPAVMTDEELYAFLKKRRGMLDGVAFTGGEPTLREDLEEVIRNVRALGYSVKLDSNGAHPEKLRRLVESGLVDYVAMDVKNDPARYAETCGKKEMDLSPIAESIDLLLHGSVDYEFRTTVVRELHDETSFINIGRMIRGAKRYFLQPFADRDTVLFAGFTAPSPAEMEKYLEAVKPFVMHAEIRGMDRGE